VASAALESYRGGCLLFISRETTDLKPDRGALRGNFCQEDTLAKIERLAVFKV